LFIQYLRDARVFLSRYVVIHILILHAILLLWWLEIRIHLLRLAVKSTLEKLYCCRDIWLDTAGGV